MKRMWNGFLRLIGYNPEFACISLFVGAFAVFASIALLVYCVVTQSYIVSVGASLIFGAVAGICVRDYRRGRWSAVSRFLMIAWLLLSAATLAYGCLIPYVRG